MIAIKVVIADDHEVVRQGLKILVEAMPDMRVVGEAADGNEAVKVAKHQKADVVLMDLAMPKLNGMDATKRVREISPNSRVLILSSYASDKCVEESLKAGATGFLTKRAAARDLHRAIRAVHEGTQFLDSAIAQRVRKPCNAFETGRNFCHLTPREMETVKMIAQGAPNKTIAADMGISIKTVEKHRQSAMDKLNIHEIAGLTKYAVDQGLLPMPGHIPTT